MPSKWMPATWRTRKGTANTTGRLKEQSIGDKQGLLALRRKKQPVFTRKTGWPTVSRAAKTQLGGSADTYQVSWGTSPKRLTHQARINRDPSSFGLRANFSLTELNAPPWFGERDRGSGRDRCDLSGLFGVPLRGATEE